jgi:hypothetical protein
LYRKQQRKLSKKYFLIFALICVISFFGFLFLFGVDSNYKRQENEFQKSWIKRVTPSIWKALLETTEQLVLTGPKIAGTCINVFLNQISLLNKLYFMVYFIYSIGIFAFFYIMYKILTNYF